MTGRVHPACPDCGPVSIPLDNALLVIANAVQWSTWLFVCTQCHAPTINPATRGHIELLMHGGVPFETFAFDTELLEVHDGPAISWDDVLDFHQAIEKGVSV